jgi:murein L,D-transpeptidase YafK
MRRRVRAFVIVAGPGLLALPWLHVRPVPVMPAPPPVVGTVDRFVIERGARRMRLLQDGRTVRAYHVARGVSPAGDKERQGDGRTPAGLVRIDRRNDRSACHLPRGLDDPQAEDPVRAAARGLDQGGDIMIHGQPNAVPDGLALAGDWTAGCIAVTNAEMRAIWAGTDGDTRVEVRP